RSSESAGFLGLIKTASLWAETATKSPSCKLRALQMSRGITTWRRCPIRLTEERAETPVLLNMLSAYPIGSHHPYLPCQLRKQIVAVPVARIVTPGRSAQCGPRRASRLARKTREISRIQAEVCHRAARVANRLGSLGQRSRYDLAQLAR